MIYRAIPLLFKILVFPDFCYWKKKKKNPTEANSFVHKILSIFSRDR